MAEGCSDAVLAAWQRAAGRSSSVARTAGVRRGCCLHGSLDARRNGSCHALMAVVCLQPAPPPPSSPWGRHALLVNRDHYSGACRGKVVEQRGLVHGSLGGPMQL